jgi:hypothetical protein
MARFIRSGGDGLFSASYDTTTKVISAVVLVVFLAIVAATHNLVVGCLIAVILVGAYAWSPRGYAVANGCREPEKFVAEVREKWGGYS